MPPLQPRWDAEWLMSGLTSSATNVMVAAGIVVENAQ